MKKSYLLIIPILIIGYYVTRAPLISVSKPIRGESIQAVFATGTVEASIMYPVSAKSMGKLIELNVDEGAEVKKDQVLAKLEDQKIVNSIEELEAREKFLSEEFNRQKKLIESKATSRDLYEKAKSELDATRAMIKGAKSQLEDLSLKAPADAKIIRRDGEIGQLIAINQAVFWIAENSPLRITAEVDEEDISKVKTGQKVLIRADAFQDKIFNGKVDSITPKGDPVARSYRVRITFNESVPLLIGMTTENNIILKEESNALLIPSSAISNDKVWVLDNNRISERKIEIGAKDLKQTQILSGINENDLIVSDPKDNFKQGQKVRVRK